MCRSCSQAHMKLTFTEILLDHVNQYPDIKHIFTEPRPKVIRKVSLCWSSSQAYNHLYKYTQEK